MKLFLVVMGLVGAMVASSAPAYGQAKVYMLGTKPYKEEVSPLISQRVHETLKERLTSHPQVTMLEKFKVKKAGGDKPASNNASIKEAERLYTAGIGLLVTDSFTEAADSFEEAVQRFEDNLAELESYDVLRDALLRLALAYNKAGEPKKGHDALRLYISLEPTEKLDPANFPLDLVKFVEDEEKKLKRQRPGILVVESNPSGAQVVLDGDLIGETPMTLEGVSPGLHYIVVKGKGAFPHVARALSKAGRKTTVKADLTKGGGDATAGGDDGGPVFLAELERRLASGEVSEDLNPYLQELSSRTGAQLVVFTIMRKADKGYEALPFVYSPEKNTLVKLQSEPFNNDMSNATLGSYQMSKRIVAATTEFPVEGIVSGSPFLVVVAPEVIKPKDPVVVKPKDPVVVKPKDPVVVKPKDPVVVKPKDPVVVKPKDPVVVKPKDPVEKKKPAELSAEVEAELNGGGVGDKLPGIGEDIGGGDDDSGAFYTQWWFWTTVGAVVVTGAIAGSVVILEDDTETSGFSATVSW